MMRLGRWFTGILVLLASVLSLPAAAQGENLLQNPGFDDPYVEVGTFGTAAEGWTPWYVGEAATDTAPLYGAAAPDLMERVLAGDNAQLASVTLATTTAGVYQQVLVPADAALSFGVSAYIWASLDGLDPAISNAAGLVTVEVGIDPLGSADPLAEGIVWSEPVAVTDSYMPLTVQARAAGTSVTVLVRIVAQAGVYAADVFLDEALLTLGDATTVVEPVATKEPTAEVVSEETPAATEESPMVETTPTMTEEAPVATEEPTAEAATEEAPPATEETPVATEEAAGSNEPVFLSEIEHVVQSGDSLYTVALVYGSDIDAIAEATGIDRETILYPGDVLVVPIPVPVAEGAPEPLVIATPTPEPTIEPTAEPTVEPTIEPVVTEEVRDEETTYTIQRGDTLIAIARNYGLNEFELAAYNGFTVMDVIRVGQVIRIPAAIEDEGTGAGSDEEGEEVTEATVTPEPTPTFRRYVIVPGDTLSRIAARFGTSVRAIIDLNNISNPNRILYGQVIRIPNE